MGACASLVRSTDDGGRPPVCTRGQAARAEFLEREWYPFVKQLRAALVDVMTKEMNGADKETRMPPQRVVLEWADRCRELTARWHGRGNLSLMYSWFIAASEHSGEAAYKWSVIPRRRSDDGFVYLVDGDTRRAAYHSDPTSSSIEPGQLPQHTGESPIDNSVLPNLMTSHDAHILLAGGHIKNAFLRSLKRRQRSLLSSLTQSGLLSHEGAADPEAVKAAAAAAAKKGIVDSESSSFKCLVATGHPVEYWSQIPHEIREEVLTRIRSEMHSSVPSAPPQSPGSPGRTTARLFQDFAEWTRNNPGRYYHNDKRLHKEMLLLGLWTRDLAVVKRSAIEETFTVHRYIPSPWTRRAALIKMDNDGTRTVVRPEGAEEQSRLRKNGFPYADEHGMGVGSGGLEEGSDHHGSFWYEAGTALGQAEAKLGNWFASDFEKILNEAEALNPAVRPGTGTADLLPGEEFFEVAQNPKAASSIGATQHTQIARGQAMRWPLYQLSGAPAWSAALEATVDCIQVGASEDSVLVKITTSTPTKSHIIKFLQGLREELMETFGGERIDFVCKALPDGDGRFVIALSPLACMELDKEKNEYANPDTTETQGQYKIPIGAVDSMSCAGNMILSASKEWAGVVDAGLPTIRAMYNLCRKPGVRAVVERYLRAHAGYECDGSGQATMGPEAAARLKETAVLLDKPMSPAFDVLLTATRHVGPRIASVFESSAGDVTKV